MHSALEIARKELKKEVKEKNIENFFLFLTLFSLLLLLILSSYNLFLTGYSSYVTSQAGYITEINLTQKFPTNYWHGIYGLALRVPGFTEQLYGDLPSGYISRKDVFFDCIEEGAVGGNEVYASTSSTINWDSLQPATLQQIDSFLGCSGRVDCASNTFTENMSIMLGTRNITNIPSTHTFKWDGDNEVFDMGILNDSSHLVFVTHIASLQKGYNPNVTVNYQMLLPTPPNTTQTYYFFTDPYDECPEGGGIGQTITATIYGYVTYSGNPLSNVSVSVAGITNLTDSEGFYNISVELIPGTYNIIARRTGYDPYFSNFTVNYTSYIINKNISLSLATPGYNNTIQVLAYGFVKDSSGNPISDVNVSLASSSTLTNSSGYYSLTPIITPDIYPIIAIKSGYNNYYSFLNFTNTTTINHNITLTSVTTKKYDYATGPYTVQYRRVIEEAIKRGEDYWISTKEIKKEVRQNTFVEETVSIYNFKSTMNLAFSISPELEDFVKLDKNSLSVPSNSFGELKLTIYGTKPIGTYNGTLKISGDLDKEIPISIRIVEKKLPVEMLLMKIDLFDKIVRPGGILRYKLSLQNLLRGESYQVFLRSIISDLQGEEYAEKRDSAELENSLTLLKEIEVPENITEGQYLLKIEARYLNYFSVISEPFIIAKPFYLYAIFGIPLWIYLIIISFLSFIFLNFFLYKKYKEKKKRYRISLDMSTLPKEGPRAMKIGLIAETKIPAYLELEKLTTHTIVAGATGMGKSISAQVIIEEALMKNIAVIVFDPTAQWSGMLRKCTKIRIKAK